MESGVDFVAADMPEANKLTVHIMAAMAEYEREQISDRTKKAAQNRASTWANSVVALNAAKSLQRV